MTTEQSNEILAFAAEVGHTLLENGAEISRVEETMKIVAASYGVDKEHFFVLSKGPASTRSSRSTSYPARFLRESIPWKRQGYAWMRSGTLLPSPDGSSSSALPSEAAHSAPSSAAACLTAPPRLFREPQFSCSFRWHVYHTCPKPWATYVRERSVPCSASCFTNGASGSIWAT